MTGRSMVRGLVTSEDGGDGLRISEDTLGP